MRILEYFSIQHTDNNLYRLLILSSILGDDDEDVFNGVSNGISNQGIPGKVPDIPILERKKGALRFFIVEH